MYKKSNMIWDKRIGLCNIQTGFVRNGVKDSSIVGIQENGSAAFTCLLFITVSRLNVICDLLFLWYIAVISPVHSMFVYQTFALNEAALGGGGGSGKHVRYLVQKWMFDLYCNNHFHDCNRSNSWSKCVSPNLQMNDTYKFKVCEK